MVAKSVEGSNVLSLVWYGSEERRQVPAKVSFFYFDHGVSHMHPPMFPAAGRCTGETLPLASGQDYPLLREKLHRTVYYSIGGSSLVNIATHPSRKG
ncbi:hypothetical protein TNCV_1189541 [Trichonephila clavipes]|nr:hypothetical protein TNCV_1189541 [Trichonephila clavipes]